MDLSTLDTTQPPDTQDRSQGAARIRETRDAVKTSFDVEHALAGAHTLPYGATGTKPAAGNAGRLFFDTTLARAEVDDGSIFRMLNAVQVGNAFTSGALAVNTASQTTVQSLTMDVPTGGRLIVLLIYTIINSGALTGATTLLLYDGSPIETFVYRGGTIGSESTMFFSFIAAPASGSKVISVQVQTSGENTVVSNRRIVGVIV